MTQKVSEADVEGYLKDKVRAQGWGIHKNISDPRRGGTPGLPDDTIVLPEAKVAWVECKSPKTIGPYTKKRTRWFDTGDTTGCSRTEVRQFTEQRKLEDQGHDVFLVGTYEEADELVALLEALYV